MVRKFAVGLAMGGWRGISLVAVAWLLQVGRGLTHHITEAAPFRVSEIYRALKSPDAADDLVAILEPLGG